MSRDSRTILLVKTSSLGDVVHNFPAASDIARHLPGARIDWAVEEAYVPLVRLHPAVDRVIPVAVRRWRRTAFAGATWQEIAVLRRSLREREYDVILDTQGLVKSALVARLASGPRAGFAEPREPIAARLYDRRFEVPRELHAIERCRRLAASALDYAVEGPARYGLRLVRQAGDAVVFLHGTARAEKQWPEANWIELGRALACPVLLPWGDAAERERSERIAAALPDASVPPRRPLDEVAAMLSRARAVIGVDTGLLHVAAALGVPLAGIFTASRPVLTGPRGDGPIEILGDDGAVPSVADVRDAYERIAR